MKTLRNLLAAAGLAGASFAAGSAVGPVDFTASRCADAWTETRGVIPNVGDNARAGESFIVCEHADRRIVTAYADGSVVGTNPDGSAMPNPESALR